MTAGGKNKINLIGERFGKLLVIEGAGSNNRGLAKWKCKCDCGNFYITTGYYLTQGRKKSCGCQNCRLYGKENPKWNGYEDINGSFWHRIKNGAKIRNLEFNISKKFIWELFLKQDKKCALTGIELKMCNSDKKQRSDLKEQTASLDRIDSSKGYIENNIQWVHKDINRIKSNMDNNSFIELCKKVAKKYEN